VPLPISRTQLDRLGERLAAASPISDEDYALLQDVLGAYGLARAAVQDRLRSRGYAVTGRLKTTGTLIDKLRREQGMKLKGVQDVAGVRIVVPGTRKDQDEAVAEVVTTFSCSDKPPRVRDRRSEPSSGYRAVHVIVVEAGLPVEVQVRTELQHLWAQVYERLADRWGRSIRYGGAPDHPDTTALDGRPPLTRAGVVAVMHRLSDQIDQIEQAQVHVRAVEGGRERYGGGRDEPEYHALGTDLVEWTARLAALDTTMRQTLHRIAQSTGREA
jgi:ppGpp synthetase/RelA/SpoT-type nucleotidyltranferase